MSATSFPRNPYPIGWFQIGWSSDLRPGDVQALDYFGQKLVMWRGKDSEEVHVQDAFCLHLGAHRGVKGRVKGDDLVCPWHEWQWNGQGENTLIPYSKEGCKKNLRIRTYPVQEWCGNIMVWYAHDASEPTWELPEIPEYDDPNWTKMHPYSRKVFKLRGHVQLPCENGADPAHVKSVHGAAEFPVIKDMRFNGPHMVTEVEVLYGGGKEQTRMTPQGPTRAVFEGHSYGVGIIIPIWRKDPWPTVQITGFTPIDDEHFHYYFQQTSLRGEGETDDAPQGRAWGMLKAQWGVIEQDFFTWENMKYLPDANFALEEVENFGRIREWAQQFYPETREAYFERRRQAKSA